MSPKAQRFLTLYAWGSTEQVLHCRKFFPTGLAERWLARGKVEVLRDSRAYPCCFLFVIDFTMEGQEGQTC